MMEIVGSRLGNIEDIPDNLRAQMSLGHSSVSKKVEEVIVKYLDGCGTIDEILVAFFREHGIVLERSKLVSRVHRMIRNGSLERVGFNNPAVYKVVQS